ncbi:30S ribosomal protein S12 methylthiotransferase RimO [candidate division CSSED10-310 bacterium]|uniref:Ribosomal protein uS12 methylthiotransferase RimO n=1 Tax=candidate division CSSED10-310 bacterium TaxID=2855610 RepID=A0ABV6YZ63_UNCC1
MSLNFRYYIRLLYEGQALGYASVLENSCDKFYFYCMKTKSYQKDSVGFYSLGCAKNLTDSEIMLGILVKEGFQIVDPVEGCEIIIVNTCAFIDDAKEESIEAVLEAVNLKNQDKCRFIIVSGCLSQRYAQQLYELIPEVDRIVGLDQIEQLGWICRNLPRRSCPKIDPPVKKYPIREFPKVHLTPGHYAYLKIADGCRNKCNYCVIPQVRGPLRSREQDDILEEANFLNELKVKELNIIAQDISSYGVDFDNGPTLIDLLRELITFSSFKWIRLLYIYPYHFDDELLEIMSSEAKVIPYLDLPIQHIDDAILKRMGRQGDSHYIYELIEKIRKKIPEISLRTTIIVGYPGETEKQFNKLIHFIKDIEFDHLGVFQYSRESGTPAAKMKYQVSKKVKEQREKDILKIQAEISKKRLRRFKGRKVDVIVEDQVQTPDDEVYFAARAPFQAPEVDGAIFIRGDSETVKYGDFRKVEISKAGTYDLFGRWCPE